MDMRNLIKLVEDAHGEEDMLPIYKAWLNPTANKAIEVSATDMHDEKVRENPQQFGLTPEDAADDDENALSQKLLERGWVRVANFNDAMLVMSVQNEDNGYVTAGSLGDARWAIRFLIQKKMLPPAMDIQIGGGAHFTHLEGDALYAFASRGILPRKI